MMTLQITLIAVKLTMTATAKRRRSPTKDNAAYYDVVLSPTSQWIVTTGLDRHMRQVLTDHGRDVVDRHRGMANGLPEVR